MKRKLKIKKRPVAVQTLKPKQLQNVTGGKGSGSGCGTGSGGTETSQSCSRLCSGW